MRRTLAALLVLLALVFARGGGGCFLAGTLVSTPDGAVPIEQMAVGDEVLSSDNGTLAISRVAELFSVQRDYYYSIETAGGYSVNVTAEHPFDVGGGSFVEASDLSSGDTIYVLANGSLAPDAVASIRRINASTGAYNLRVDGTHTFFANNYSVHNKGCFPAGTIVAMADGSQKAIERLAPGDEVLSFDSSGSTLGAHVSDVYSLERDGYYEIRTPLGEVDATAEHPFYIGNGLFREAKGLVAGDALYVLDPYGGVLAKTTITSITYVPSPTRVYNLRVDGAHTFFAEGFAVHNKGGCFPGDTLISCGIDGCEKPLGLIVPGDKVLSFNDDGSLVESTVEDVYSLESDEYYTITTASGSVNATAEHPFLTDEGFVAVENLHAGDFIYVRSGESFVREQITGKVLVSSPTTVYNLHVSGPNTFFANDYAVHNKGGCFLPGTLVSTADGAAKPIETVHAGDSLLSFDGDSLVESAALELIVVERDYYYSILTMGGMSVNVTAEHPFYTGNGSFTEASTIRAGDTVYVMRDGVLSPDRVSSVRRVDEPTVAYNLHVSEPNTFFANGFAVHNKGGGGGSSHSSPPSNTFYYNCSHTYNDSGVIKNCCKSSSKYMTSNSVVNSTKYPFCRCTFSNGTIINNTDRYLYGAKSCECAATKEEILKHNTLKSCPMTPIEMVSMLFCLVLPIGFALLIFIFQVLLGYRILKFIPHSGYAANSEWSSTVATPKSMISAKSKKTCALLEQWGKVDPAWAEARLKGDAESTFTKLQECWGKRDYTEMKPLMTENLYLQHVAQLEAMKARHEINRMDDLKVLGMEIVLVNNHHDKSKDSFVAWVNASARDTIVDDRTGNKIRGDVGAGIFEEYWAFQRSGNSWLLDRIDQPEEGMDILNKENFDSLLPKSSLERQYEKAGGPAIKDIGPGAMREQIGATVGLGMDSIKGKAGRVSRLLNFLYESDKIWDETKMRMHVRALFVTFNVGLELGSLDSVKAGLSPELASQYEKELAALKARGQKVQKRNLALRNAEIVLVKNYYDNKKDEFTAWLSGQAQSVIIDAKTEKVVDGDSHVADFEEYWTFRRNNDRWMLVSIEQGFKKYVEEENFDEGTGKIMLEWYYKQDRS